MTVSSKHLAFAALGLAAVAGTGFASAGNDSGAALHCEIVETASAGMSGIEARASSREPMAGTYRLVVTGPGANINQGGEFETRSGQTETLGSVMLGGNGGPYNVRLEVKAGGRTYACEDVIRHQI
ncbi:curli-like amyloid fiber formation chaperone CsgH [Mesorhizobium sp. CAU 1741]|uniref:curli-like amyloid fiber formation chaperone CsgH n=1 Tax=Mesorhizobium sp. CAU 1741 TaxID=3140366 RepID=UPI00325AB246